MNIQWYPGHMTKTRRMIVENLKNIDAVCEIVDARIPVSSRNPDLDALAARKPRLIILNRVDLADKDKTAMWSRYFRGHGMQVVETNSKSGIGVNKFAPALRELLNEKLKYYNERGLVGRLIRVMICGIPNVGKSTFINRVAGRTAAKAEDRPGVTRGKQWIRVDEGIDMMDTPGMLWPKFEDKLAALHLAYTGAVKDDILDTETLAAHLMETLVPMYPDALTERYKIDISGNIGGYELLRRAAEKRSLRISGGEFDLERMARVLLDEFRAGQLGRMTLELPSEIDREPLLELRLKQYDDDAMITED
ncbi:MAG: ribosome biogenesis GTPase YlqF, partial [Clostridia bacterium]